MTKPASKPFVGIVGPCGSGKTTLKRSLEQHQIQARHIAQEHSYVPDMWQRISHPEFLIYLDVSYENATKRRKLNWTLAEYEEQLSRLRHARAHCDLFIETDKMTPEEIFSVVLLFIQNKARSF